MEKYKLVFAKNVRKDLRKIPNKDVIKILELIESLASNPFPSNVKKLSHMDKFRIRYRQYRIVYQLIKNELIMYVIKIGDRKDIYKYF
jgi:mRNA interferase RelE/StbE